MQAQFNSKVSSLSEISEYQRSINFGRIKSVGIYVKIMFLITLSARMDDEIDISIPAFSQIFVTFPLSKSLDYIQVNINEIFAIEHDHYSI